MTPPYEGLIGTINIQHGAGGVGELGGGGQALSAFFGDAEDMGGHAQQVLV